MEVRTISGSQPLATRTRTVGQEQQQRKENRQYIVYILDFLTDRSLAVAASTNAAPSKIMTT